MRHQLMEFTAPRLISALNSESLMRIKILFRLDSSLSSLCIPHQRDFSMTSEFQLQHHMWLCCVTMPTSVL